MQKHRTRIQKENDREEILKLLRIRPRTVAELAKAIGQPDHNVDFDLRMLGRRVGKTREGIKNVWHITGSPKPYVKASKVDDIGLRALFDRLPEGTEMTIVLRRGK